MRDASVPKIVFLLSDGRTADYPKDLEFSAAMRRAIPNLSIWAYGTGDYVAIEELANMTGSYEKIVTNKNLTQLEPMFDAYKGIEICEKAPGTKYPLCIDPNFFYGKHRTLTIALQFLSIPLQMYPLQCA